MRYLRLMLSSLNFPMARTAALLLPLAAVVAGCTYAHGGDDAPVPCDNASATRATYQQVIKPIFAANCNSCHGSAVAGALGDYNVFDNHAALAAYNAALLLGSIKHTPGYDPMPKAGARISDCDIARIEAWIAAGRPNN